MAGERHLEIQEHRDGGTCSYCDAPLDPKCYACLECGKPYKKERKLLAGVSAPYLSEDTLIKMKAPKAYNIFWAYMGVSLLTAVLSFLAFEDDRPDLVFLFQIGAAFGLTCVYGALNFGDLVPQFKRIGFTHHAAWLGLLMLVPLLFVNYVYHSWIMDLIGNDYALNYWAKLSEAGLDRGSIIFGMCVFPAVAEEIAFRGLLQEWLQRAIKPERAIVVTSFLFTVLHFSVVSAPYLFCIGAVMGWMKWKTKSLYPSIIFHFIHNFIVIEFLFV